MTIMVGTDVGPYRIDEFLDAGGMGEVYQATDTRLGRRVAIKVLPAELAEKDEYRRRFDREIKAISRVAHKNICTLYDAGVHEGQPFIAMEYLEGRTLREVFERGPATIEEVVSVAIQVVSALEAAHRRGIIHRDIKPSNIVLSEQGDAKVLDFGIAKAVQTSETKFPVDGDITTEGGQVGTLAYMSPEQALGKQVDARSDLFSLGLVLYEMATGQLPYVGPAAAILGQLVSTEPVPRPVHLRVSIPSELDRIICRMLEKDPRMRYQTAGDLLAALRALRRDLDADGIRPPRVVTPTSPVPARSRLSRRLGVTAFVGIGAVGALWLVYGLGAGGTSAIQTIAVFPCSDPLGQARTEYLCDLLAERIRANLRTIEGLTVVSPLQLDAFGAEQLSEMQIAQQLGVDGVLTAQLLGAAAERSALIEVTDLRTGASLWSRTFEMGSSGRLEPDLHNRIATSVAEGLALELSASERERVRLAGLYNDARYFAEKRTDADLERAIAIYEEVIAADAEHAEAFSGLAMARVLMPYYAGTAPTDAYPQAISAAERAIELDPRNAEAHAALGLAYRDYRRDWVGARREFERALSLDAEEGTALQWYAELLAGLGEFEAAKARIAQARAALPLDLPVQAVEGWILLCAGELDEARALLTAALDKDPEFALSNWFLGELHFAAQDYAAAASALEIAVRASGRASRMVADLASAYAMGGRVAEARALLSELDRLATSEWVSGYEYAIVHAALGERDVAIARLEEAVMGNETWQIVNMGVDPMLAPLRSDPRFAELLSRAGLGQVQRGGVG